MLMLKRRFIPRLELDKESDQSRIEIKIAVTPVAPGKIVDPQTSAYFTTNELTGKGYSKPVGASLKDNYANEHKLEEFEPYARPIYPNETREFELSFRGRPRVSVQS